MQINYRTNILTDKEILSFIKGYLQYLLDGGAYNRAQYEIKGNRVIVSHIFKGEVAILRALEAKEDISRWWEL